MLVFHKFLEPNRHFTLTLDSNGGDGFTRPNYHMHSESTIPCIYPWSFPFQFITESSSHHLIQYRVGYIITKIMNTQLCFASHKTQFQVAFKSVPNMQWQNLNWWRRQYTTVNHTFNKENKLILIQNTILSSTPKFIWWPLQGFLKLCSKGLSPYFSRLYCYHLWCDWILFIKLYYTS